MKLAIPPVLLLISFSCSTQPNQNEMSKHAHTNSLINSTSPYLQQHAHNPVDWQEWSEEALTEAKEKDKPIIVSIGYSSCHWCHVMEKESFEDTAVANLMNKHFINIKVDREERPDVDQIYMDAVQAMGINGGWPLNVFLTPDQKPFYGGTYFPNQGWTNLLTNVAEAFENNREKINESADAFTQNLRLKESEKYTLTGTDFKLSEDQVHSSYQTLAAKFDRIDGGIKKSPKFPMPAVWKYVATYAHVTGNEDAIKHFEFTLSKIADGGIYDHVGGGFARYSTDEEWHVPHFEKMLYDNGQLLSLYADGYKLTGNAQFRSVIMETIDWLEREMRDPSGGYYSALDADSEGEEGKFYVWSYDEIKDLAGNHTDLIASYYDVKKEGNWEGKNAIRVVGDKSKLVKQFKLSESEFDQIILEFKQKALVKRDKRERPGLDNKMIAGWNGLLLSGLVESYQATNEPSILALAKENARFLKEKLVKGDQLNRFPDKDLEGFLEDYAAVIQAFVKYYETTFDWEYLETAKRLLNRVNENFYDESEDLYFFTGDDSESLIARKKEFFDNVIPSSNSLMVWNLIHLGTHFYDESLISQGKKILGKVSDLIVQEPEYMSYWGSVALELSQPFAEVVVIGDNYQEMAQEFNRQFLPNKVLTAAQKEQPSPLFEYKTAVGGETTIYVCYDKSCKRPVKTTKEALDLLK